MNSFCKKRIFFGVVYLYMGHLGSIELGPLILLDLKPYQYQLFFKTDLVSFSSHFLVTMHWGISLLKKTPLTIDLKKNIFTLAMCNI